jgi:hypothetical protein
VLALEELEQTPSIYVDGTLVHTGLESTKTFSYLPTKIGTSRQGGFQGEIGEVIMVSTVLEPADRKK